MSHHVVNASVGKLGATPIGSYNLLNHNGPKTATVGDIPVNE